jgi:3-phosphoshikimate 1-carboxyvinyltransferase
LGLSFQAGSPAGSILIHSPGLSHLTSPAHPLDAGNSGTTMRLISGIAAGRPFETTLDGDNSLRSRPMSRVLTPLTEMGAAVDYKDKSGFAPFTISGATLRAITFDASVASAQVQTALLLAGLQAEGETVVKVPGQIRDHTVRLFKHIGVPHRQDKNGTVAVHKLAEPLPPFQADVPADISSAAFFMVASALLPGSNLVIQNVGINPGRRLVLDVLKRMGADVCLQNEGESAGEPVGDIAVRYGGRLKGTTIVESEIAAGIDEIPALALAGAFCDGIFKVAGAAELRVKESDRLSAIVGNLRGNGATITELEDGFEIEGSEELAGGSSWKTFDDHRLAMTGIIANLVCKSSVATDDPNCVRISYPTFKRDLEILLS